MSKTTSSGRPIFKRARALLLGDMMLDVYTLGHVERISPEAPVPVLRAYETRKRAGGAGNVALNLISLGVEVVVCGRVGSDTAGSDFLKEMNRERADVRGLFVDEATSTPVKTRMIADNQQLLRVDVENPQSLEPLLEEQVISKLPALMEGVDVVALSDYAKGFLTPRIIQEALALAGRLKIPTIVDPKGVDFTRYSGASVLKPNLGEAIYAANLERGASLDLVAQRLLATLAIETLMITRSKEGISLFDLSAGRRDFATFPHEVKDVTGAGDTVLAVMTAALASGLDLGEGAKLANIAAGMAVERLGCARITLAELEQRLMKIGTLTVS